MPSQISVFLLFVAQFAPSERKSCQEGRDAMAQERHGLGNCRV